MDKGEKRKLIKIKTVYGETLYVDFDEYKRKIFQGRPLLKVYWSTGRLRKIKHPGRKKSEIMLLHIDNIDKGYRLQPEN